LTLLVPNLEKAERDMNHNWKDNKKMSQQVRNSWGKLRVKGRRGLLGRYSKNDDI